MRAGVFTVFSVDDRVWTATCDGRVPILKQVTEPAKSEESESAGGSASAASLEARHRHFSRPTDVRPYLCSQNTRDKRTECHNPEG